jgi:beta-glucosidase
MTSPCVGNTGSVESKGMRGLCLQDGPLGVRFGDYVSVFPAGLTAAATWDRELIYARANALAQEHHDKGVDVLLAPVSGPIGRFATGGRNWEGFSPDPYLSGVAMEHSVKGMQDAGVIACAKHFIGNEQGECRRWTAFSRPRLYVSVLGVHVHQPEIWTWPLASPQSP